MAATARRLLLAVLMASFGGGLVHAVEMVTCSCNVHCTGSTATICAMVSNGGITFTDPANVVHTLPNMMCVISLTDVILIPTTDGLLQLILNPLTCGGRDPVVTGFNGGQFEFAGLAGQAYSFLTMPDHSLNVAMVPANLAQKEAGGTFIGNASLVYKGHTIQASVDEAENLTVSVDDTVITKDTLETAPNHAAEFNLKDDDTVAVQLFHADFGHSVRMETPLMIATVYVTPPGLDAYYNQVVRGYLNLAIQLKPSADLSQMHGVMGLTIHPKTSAGANATAVNTIIAFNGEGEEADYQVSSLTMSDSKFNTFGKPIVKHVTARRILTNGDAIVPIGIATVAPPMLANVGVRTVK